MAQATSSAVDQTYRANARVTAVKAVAAQPQQMHPLSRMHDHQIGQRPRARWMALAGVWGVTWNLATDTHAIRPLGRTSMAVMSYHYNQQYGNFIEYRCVTARMDNDTGVIYYDHIRMAHDFGTTPHPGAVHRVLDPRPDSDRTITGSRANGSWVALGLELDASIAFRSQSMQPHTLDVEPRLPEFLAGFREKQGVPTSFTEPLLRWVASQAGMPYARLLTEEPTSQANHVATYWDALWQAPTEPTNPTGYWLIHVDMLERPQDAPALFEDFTDMMGSTVPNPSRAANTLKFANPVRRIAADLEIDLPRLLDICVQMEKAAAADPAKESNLDAENAGKVDGQGDAPNSLGITVDGHVLTERELEAECRIFETLYNAVLATIDPAYHELLTEVTAKQLLPGYTAPAAPLAVAMNNPDAPITVPNVDLQKLPAEVAIAACRHYWKAERPWVNQCATNDEILAAVQDPKTPMHIRAMCQPQVLRLNRSLDVADAFTFASLTGRIRVGASLWSGPDWRPA